MENSSHNARLTFAELANLWTQYQNDSMSVCVINYFLGKVQDKDVQALLEFANSLAQSHIQKMEEFFNQENYPVPKGFTQEDVNLNAPSLFSDTFMPVYLHIMTIHGLTGYAAAVSTSLRADQINYFIQCNTEAMELYKRTIDVMLNKGIIVRPASFNAPEGINFLKKQSFLAGWFADKRPLNAEEASGVYFNMQKTVVKIVLQIGFSQVAQIKEVRDYISRGEKLCDRQFDILNSILSESNLPSPKKWDAEVSNSTVPPFSDKLLLFHIVTLVSTAAGYYGAAYSVSQRRDLAVQYAQLIADISKYAEDGVNLLIKNGWMEQPPMADDREHLANKK